MLELPGEVRQWEHLWTQHGRNTGPLCRPGREEEDLAHRVGTVQDEKVLDSAILNCPECSWSANGRLHLTCTGRGQRPFVLRACGQTAGDDHRATCEAADGGGGRGGGVSQDGMSSTSLFGTKCFFTKKTHFEIQRTDIFLIAKRSTVCACVRVGDVVKHVPGCTCLVTGEII